MDATLSPLHVITWWTSLYRHYMSLHDGWHFITITCHYMMDERRKTPLHVSAWRMSKKRHYMSLHDGCQKRPNLFASMNIDIWIVNARGSTEFNCYQHTQTSVMWGMSAYSLRRGWLCDVLTQTRSTAVMINAYTLMLHSRRNTYGASWMWCANTTRSTAVMNVYTHTMHSRHLDTDQLDNLREQVSPYTLLHRHA